MVYEVRDLLMHWKGDLVMISVLIVVRLNQTELLYILVLLFALRALVYTAITRFDPLVFNLEKPFSLGFSVL